MNLFYLSTNKKYCMFSWIINVRLFHVTKLKYLTFHCQSLIQKVAVVTNLENKFTVYTACATASPLELVVCDNKSSHL